MVEQSSTQTMSAIKINREQLKVTASGVWLTEKNAAKVIVLSKIQVYSILFQVKAIYGRDFVNSRINNSNSIINHILENKLQWKQNQMLKKLKN